MGHEPYCKPGIAPRPTAAELTRAYEPWAALNVPRALQPASPVGRPAAVLVLAQPGAGNAALTESLRRDFADRGGCVVIDPNELLYLHPAYASLAEQDVDVATAALRPLARRLANEILAAAIDRRVNVVYDGPSLVHARAAETVQKLKSAGYTVTVLALAVPPEESWAAVQQREADQAAESGHPRRCDRATHDAARQALPTVLEALEHQALADEIHVLTRDGQRLSSATAFQGYTPGSAGRALTSMTAEPSPADLPPEPAPHVVEPNNAPEPFCGTPNADASPHNPDDPPIVNMRRTWQNKIRDKAASRFASPS